MRSMIEQVTEAEARAASIRQDAAAAAREAVAAAQAKVEETLAAQAQAARTALRQACEQAEVQGRALAENIFKERDQQAQAQCAKARERLPQAVEYLLGRVVTGQ